ncbi:hypothetical protein B0H10DRAFT_1952701 [Mycena sp. CBHHK59/15]|nr:hypothetical protein B0H10DRAFT_1952701 [Mycena sp. CBHHK59/15]
MFKATLALNGWWDFMSSSWLVGSEMLIQQTAVAHQQIFKAIEEIVFEDTGENLQWHHIHGKDVKDYDSKILHWGEISMAVKPRKLAQQFPDRMDLHQPECRLASLTPYEHLHRCFHLCVTHVFRNIQKCKVKAPCQRIDVQSHWVHHKEHSQFAFGAMCWAKSFIPEDVFEQSGIRASYKMGHPTENTIKNIKHKFIAYRKGLEADDKKIWDANSKIQETYDKLSDAKAKVQAAALHLFNSPLAGPIHQARFSALHRAEDILGQQKILYREEVEAAKLLVAGITGSGQTVGRVRSPSDPSARAMNESPLRQRTSPSPVFSLPSPAAHPVMIPARPASVAGCPESCGWCTASTTHESGWCTALKLPMHGPTTTIRLRRARVRAMRWTGCNEIPAAPSVASTRLDHVVSVSSRDIGVRVAIAGFVLSTGTLLTPLSGFSFSITFHRSMYPCCQHTLHTSQRCASGSGSSVPHVHTRTLLSLSGAERFSRQVGGVQVLSVRRLRGSSGGGAGWAELGRKMEDVEAHKASYGRTALVLGRERQATAINESEPGGLLRSARGLRFTEETETAGEARRGGDGMGAGEGAGEGAGGRRGPGTGDVSVGKGGEAHECPASALVRSHDGPASASTWVTEDLGFGKGGCGEVREGPASAVTRSCDGPASTFAWSQALLRGPAGALVCGCSGVRNVGHAPEDSVRGAGERGAAVVVPGRDCLVGEGISALPGGVCSSGSGWDAKLSAGGEAR